MALSAKGWEAEDEDLEKAEDDAAAAASCEPRSSHWGRFLARTNLLVCRSFFALPNKKTEK